MPISAEGLGYSRFTFKPLMDYDTGGCRADVYLPDPHAFTSCPVALFFHGGAFVFGDTHVILLGHFQYLLDRGFCVVSAEYRMNPHAPMVAQREDWVDAYRWVSTELGRITGGRVDGSRTFVFGPSAGGSAALWVGVDAARTGLPPPKAVYAVYPCTDFALVEAGQVGPNEPYSTFAEHVTTLPEDQARAIRCFMAGPGTTGYDNTVLASPWTPDPEIKPTPRKRWFDQVFATNTFASAILGEDPPFSDKHSLSHHMTKQYPPTIFLRAMEDTTLQPEQTSHAYDRLEALGVECKMISVPGMQHGDVELIQPGRRERWEVWFKDVCSVALEWCMEKCGEPKSLKVNGVVHGVVKAGIPGLLGEVTAGLVDGTVA